MKRAILKEEKCVGLDGLKSRWRITSIKSDIIQEASKKLPVSFQVASSISFQAASIKLPVYDAHCEKMQLDARSHDCYRSSRTIAAHVLTISTHIVPPVAAYGFRWLQIDHFWVVCWRIVAPPKGSALKHFWLSIWYRSSVGLRTQAAPIPILRHPDPILYDPPKEEEDECKNIMRRSCIRTVIIIMLMTIKRRRLIRRGTHTN